MRDYALTAFIFALLPICVYRPWIGILAWYWFGIMNPHRLTWDFAYSMPFALLIGGATLIGAVVAKDRKPIPWNLPLALSAALLVYYLFTTFFAWWPSAAWAQMEKVAKIVIMTFVTTMFIYGRARIRAVLLVAILSVGFYGIKGAVFAVRSGGGRVNGVPDSFLDGNTFIGLAFCMVLPLLIFMARDEHRPWMRRLLYAIAVLTFVATIFTYSRGAYLALGAVSILIFLHFKRRILAALVLAPAILIVPGVLPDRVFERAELIEKYEQDSSANQRLAAWRVAINIAMDRPLTGAGFEFEYSPDRSRWFSYADERAFKYLRGSSAAHSIYFQIMGQHGLIAFGMFVTMLLATLISLQRTRMAARDSPATGWLANYAIGLQLGMVGWMAAGAFLNSAYFDLAYLYIALSAVLHREVQAARQTAIATPATASTGSTPLTARHGT